MTQIVFRPEAEADLSAIALHVAQHSKERARALIDRLRTRVQVLNRHPDAGRMRNDIAPDIRSLVSPPYVFHRPT